MVTEMITEIDDIKAECTEDKLFRRAVNDAIEAMMRRTVVGLSISEATVALELLRQHLEKANR